MSPVQPHCVFWPPAKSSFLTCLPGPVAQAMVKDIGKGIVNGLNYRIDGERIYLKDKPKTLYFIQIDGWSYSIKNDSHEYPVLSFSYLDTGLHHAPMDKSIRNVRVLGQVMRRGYRLNEKAMRAASYLMRQIALGSVVDAQRVLSLYKLTPPHPMVPGFVQNSFAYAQNFFREAD